MRVSEDLIIHVNYMPPNLMKLMGEILLVNQLRLDHSLAEL